jgi:hypothetical protein
MQNETCRFAHRQNLDGTFDSICLRCFLTVVRSEQLSGIGTLEAKHSCFDVWRRKRQEAISPSPSLNRRTLTDLIADSSARIQTVQQPDEMDHLRTVGEIEEIIKQLGSAISQEL